MWQAVAICNPGKPSVSAGLSPGCSAVRSSCLRIRLRERQQGLAQELLRQPPAEEALAIWGMRQPEEEHSLSDLEIKK